MSVDTAATRQMVTDVMTTLPDLHKKLDSVEITANKAAMDAASCLSAVSQVKSNVDDLQKEFADLSTDLSGKVERLETFAYSSSSFIFDSLKASRIADYEYHQSTFVLASPKFDIYASPQDWVHSVVELLLAANSDYVADEIYAEVGCVYVLDKKLYKRARRSKSVLQLKYPLQLVVQMSNLKTKIEATDSLSKMFKRRPETYKDHRVSRFIPPSLQPEHAQLKKIMAEVMKDKRNARYTIIPVFDSLVGYTLKVLFSPDISSQPMSDYVVHWDRPYPSAGWKPST